MNRSSDLRGPRVAFLGSKELGLRALTVVLSAFPGKVVAVGSIDDRSDTRSKLSFLASRAGSNGVPFDLISNARDQRSWLTALAPDIVVVCGWYWIIPADLVEQMTCLGIHHSLLPRYRGGSPLVWAMIEGEKVVGTTLFKFDEGADSGPILGQASTPVSKSDSIQDVVQRLDDKALELLRINLPLVSGGRATLRVQNHEGATYRRQRRPSDGLIDWTQGAESIYNFIRAQSVPYPGAFSRIGGDRLTIWTAASNGFRMAGPPGKLIAGNVACGDGFAVSLKDVEFRGQRGTPEELIGPHAQFT